MSSAGGCSRRLKGETLAAILLAVAGTALAGCSGSHQPGDRIRGRILTIYSSSPLQGASSVSGQAVVFGARLALAQVGSRIGRYRIKFEALDDATFNRGGWDPGQTSVNARLAALDPTTIGYLGELNSGASAVSIPSLNRALIPQISPTSTAVGLTSAAPGAAPGEPLKYYPTGVRTFARVVPNDSVQALAQVRLQKSSGCKRTYVLDDGEFDGEHTATSFALAAQSNGLQLASVQAYDPRAANFLSLASAIATAGANCVLISATPETGAVLLTEELALALPKVKLFATAGLAESTYTDPAKGGIPQSLDPRVLVTAGALGPGAYGPAGEAFFSEYRRRYGPAEPYAILGYAAMSVMLDAIARATDHGTKPAVRQKVISAIFSTRDLHSVLGTYSIDTDGDTTLRRYGVYRIVAGQLSFWKAVEG